MSPILVGYINALYSYLYEICKTSCAKIPYSDVTQAQIFRLRLHAYKSSAVRGHIGFKAALFYNSLGYEGIRAQPTPTSKVSKVFQSRARPAREREPMIENHQWDAGHHIDLESPHFPTSDSLPTPQSRSSHWRMRKYWDASSIRDHWPCRKLWIDHDPASQAVRTSHAFHDQTTANMTERLDSFQSHWKSFFAPRQITSQPHQKTARQ